MKRHKTCYPGVFFREAGGQCADDGTAAGGNQCRRALTEGRAETPEELEAACRAEKQAEASRWTISRLWAEYCEAHAANKVLRAEPLKFDSAGKLPGRLLSERRRIFDRIRKAAGLPEGFRPLHGLRHAWASMPARSGQVEMHTSLKLLTHRSPQMKQRYAHLRDEALKKASDLAGSIVERASNGKENARARAATLRRERAY